MDMWWVQPFSGIKIQIRPGGRDELNAFLKHVGEGCGKGHDHNVAVAFDGNYVLGSELLGDCYRDYRGVEYEPRGVEVPRSLLEALAPEDPMNQDEQGGCVWCGHTDGTSYGYATADPKHHEADCPWLEARRLLA